MTERASHVAALNSARRRRERKLRSMWRHEIASIKMAVLCATHHSAQRCAHVDQGVQVGVPWTHDFEMSETSDESPVAEYVAPAPAVVCDGPAPVIEYMSSTPVIEYVAPAIAVSLSVHGQQLPPANTMTADTTDAIWYTRNFPVLLWRLLRSLFRLMSLVLFVP